MGLCVCVCARVCVCVSSLFERSTRVEMPDLQLIYLLLSDGEKDRSSASSDRVTTRFELIQFVSVRPSLVVPSGEMR